jgi:hypothetical protein
MILKTKLNLEDYRKLVFTLTYRKPLTLLMSFLGLYMTIGGALTYFGVLSNNENMPFQFVFGIVLTVLTPYKIYTTANRNYSTNLKLQEEIDYEFTPEQLIIKGESFTSELKWSTTFKIEELTHWILIYQSKTTANIIPKKNISEAELEELRFIFRAQKNITVKLK